MTPSASNSGGRRLRTDHRCRALGDPKDGSALVVEHLTKRFAERVAFDDVSSRSGAARCSASSVSTGRGRPQPCIPLFAYWGICAAIAVSAPLHGRARPRPAAERARQRAAARHSGSSDRLWIEGHLVF